MKNAVSRLLPSALALAVIAALPTGAQAAGFVEDAKVSLNLRNYYFNRNYLNGTDPLIRGERQGQAEGWTQSFILDARSGFTEGTVGFGLDLLGLYSVKLDGNRGAANSQLLPIHDDGQAADDFG
ncbi:OprD family outer membrane porin, partial [Pseudomonas sp. EGD-AK9]|uniref:OprD family outer membrane porin n=1 Tax=Pseudomonas sp. EGD-AK9 TaxID=1386078 RepID=UPI0004CDED8B